MDDFWKNLKPLAKAAGATDEAFKNWRKRGFVPRRWHFTLVRLARAGGFDLSSDELELRFDSDRGAA